MINKISAFKILVKNGMSEKLAEAFTQTIEEMQDGLIITKGDLRAELQEFTAVLDNIKTDIKWLKYIGVLMLCVLIVF